MIKKIKPLYNNAIYNRLTILYCFDSGKKTRCICKCSCDGNIKEYYFCNIITNHTKSCGCINTEIRKNNHCKNKGINHPGYKHGQVGTYLYRLFYHIKNRCCDLNNKQYKDYGGRGIEMFKPWINDFLKFEIDIVNEIGHKPFQHLTLDRINNDGNYEPGNLQWATRKEQSNNRTRKALETREGQWNYMVDNFARSIPKHLLPEKM